MDKTRTLRDQILAQNPTSQQQDAIFAENLEFLLRAAPGSGKTWTSCRRFIWRGANWPHSAGGLALLSFTNAAIREFQQATIKIGRRDLLSDPNYVGTFDSFVERFILAPFGHLISGLSWRPKLFIAPRPGDRNNKKLMAWLELKGGNKQPVFAWEIVPYPKDTKIAYRTQRGLDLSADSNARQAVMELMSLGYYTHGQRVYWAVRLLYQRPHLARLLARGFPEIIVDEAQDTNAWLLILLNLIRTQGSKVTLVGDPDQCIYEFSMADVTSLLALKEKWDISEKPLSQSFRCNNQIANAVRNIGGNQSFIGYGDAMNISCIPYITRETNEQFSLSVAEFKKALDRAGIDMASSAILCRGHQQLELIRGEANYEQLQGATKEFAKASFLRDCRRDYKRAFDLVTVSIRLLVDDPDLWKRIDEAPESIEAQRVNLAIWRFVRSQTGLPPVNLSASEWIPQLRTSLGRVLADFCASNVPNLNQRIKKTGLNDMQTNLSLFSQYMLFPPIRQETIHGVKGESINGVLVLGSAKFWNSVIDSVSKRETSEDRRLAYVAMSRARHLLVVGLPATHFDKHKKSWVNWGFSVL